LNPAPIREPAGERWSQSWSNWFQQATNCLRWKQSFNVTAIIDFPSIVAQQQALSAVTVTGARSGDAVMVTPAADVTGLIFTGVVTAADTVTVYAKNFSGIAVDAASQTFRIIVLQN